MQFISETNTWSLQLPAQWSAKQDEACVTFSASPAIGALQLSSYRKDEPVSNKDLLDFAWDEVESPTELMRIAAGSFTGFYTSYIDRGGYWRKWWLRDGHCMIYATYTSDVDDAEIETETVDATLASLQSVNLSETPRESRR